MKTFGILLVAMLTFGSARAEQLVMLVDTSTEMPMADIRAGAVQRGMNKELAGALALKLGRTAVVQPLPRKRIAMALESGQGDLLCQYLPEWLPGRFGWTQAFMPQSELVITSLSLPRPQSLRELAGQPIGTVLGYQYPEMELALGKGFVRADAHSNLTNLRKLAAGRVRHVATIKSFFDYQVKVGEKAAVHPPLVVKSYMTRCAVSHKGRVTLADIDSAITQLVREGTINKILSNYQ